MERLTLITAIAGLVFGFLGAVLGVLNTIRTFVRDRVHLRVAPVFVFYGEGQEGFGIEVTNLSAFPVTVIDIGFMRRGRDDKMSLLLFPGLLGCKLSQRMEPRTSFTGFLPVAACDHPNFSTIARAYATTGCGQNIKGTSKALRQFAESRRARTQK